MDGCVDALRIICENFPHCDEWLDESFAGRLHEECILDKAAYWRLEWAVVSLTKKECDYPHHLVWQVFRIFSATMNLLMANVNQNDGYKIENIDPAQEQEFFERFQLVFEGFFRGERPDLGLAFDEVNPLFQRTH